MTGSSSVPGPRRLTRNWGELLQELRVVQTGVQILTGFLLTLPFTDRFERLDDTQVRVYLAVLCGSVLTTGFVVAPVAFHRMVFRDHRRAWLVAAADVTALVGLGLLALTSSGVLFLVFDVSVGRTPAVLALVVALAFFALLWVATPLTARLTTPPDGPPPEDEDRDQ